MQAVKCLALWKKLPRLMLMLTCPRIEETLPDIMLYLCSAGVAFVIGSTQLIAALANAPKHLPVQEVAQVRMSCTTAV